jgi:hypothetical protein
MESEDSNQGSRAQKENFAKSSNLAVKLSLFLRTIMALVQDRTEKPSNMTLFYTSEEEWELIKSLKMIQNIGITLSYEKLENRNQFELIASTVF